MKPVYEDASNIPYLLASHCTKLKMTNTRKKQLIKAANRNWNEPPPKPNNDECCGSNCTPCVKDLWNEDVIVWKQRWGLEEDEIKEKVQSKRQVTGSKLPGSYDW